MRRALARVDLEAIAHNARVLDRAAGSAALCAVVKADGYGHGAVQAARAALAGGASWLAVATADEAAQLRAADVPTRILVMGALSLEELDVALAADADVVAWTTEMADAVAARGGGRVHVKLDSGMGRLGERGLAAAEEVVARVGRPAGLMTHFATADERGDAFLGEQLDRFVAWASPHKQRDPALLLHAANSAATLREPRAHLDLVRCGVALYGLDPFGADPAEHDLRPALRLETYVAAVKPVAPGESAGYGRRFVAAAPTTTGTLPIGYGDGVRRGLTNNADVLVGGRRVPLVGTVSMDNVTVDLGMDPDVAVGDPAVLIGEQGGERILAEELARRLDTINYEITCGLGPRVPRVYEGGEEGPA
jgi:alanine racemase